ncbi:hypothetical protein DFJ73DRAFT_873959 [Zopfochytrium polystomum]|nr:hypothetical protein DFJ73DRAFT_873959 [Zopfochytrium polystomum]
MAATDEVTWQHVVHGLKLSVIAAVIVASFLWAFSAIEVALVNAGSRNPPDSACLYFGMMTATDSLYFFFARQVDSVHATGRLTVLPRDPVFALIDLSMVVVPSLLAKSRTAFFGAVSFAYFPGPFIGTFFLLAGEPRIVLRITKAVGFAILVVTQTNLLNWWIVFNFYVVDSADIQTAKGLFINAAIITVALLYRSFGVFFSSLTVEVFGRRAEPVSNPVQSEIAGQSISSIMAPADASASNRRVFDDSDHDELPAFSDRAAPHMSVQSLTELSNAFVIISGRVPPLS